MNNAINKNGDWAKMNSAVKNDSENKFKKLMSLRLFRIISVMPAMCYETVTQDKLEIRVELLASLS